MSKARVKLGLFLVGGLLALVLGAVGFSALTQFITDFQRGADPASIFRGNKLIVPKEHEARWLPESTSVLTPTLAEQEEIVAAYWLAWQAVSRAHQTGDSSDLPTYWAGTAYFQAMHAIGSEGRFAQEHGGHKLELTFFSDDHSVVAFNDHDFVLRQTMNKQTLTLTASASVVMTLDNGFWRIRVLTLHYR